MFEGTRLLWAGMLQGVNNTAQQEVQNMYQGFKNVVSNIPCPNINKTLRYSEHSESDRKLMTSLPYKHIALVNSLKQG